MSVAPAEWLCSEIRPSDHPELLTASVSPQAARELGLADGDLAWALSDFGRVKCRIQTNPDLRSDLVVIPRGGWGARGCNVNLLTRALVTAVGGGTAYYQSRVDLEKI